MPPSTAEAFTLVVEVARLLVPHFDRQVTVGTGDIVHRLRLKENDLIVALAPGHCAVLQGPRLIHLPGRDSIITARKQGRQRYSGRGHWR